MCVSVLQRHTIEDLHSNEKGARSRARASQAAQQRLQEDCTFKPALDPNSLALAGQRRQMGAPSLLDRLDQDMSTKVKPAAGCVVTVGRTDCSAWCCKGHTCIHNGCS